MTESDVVATQHAGSRGGHERRRHHHLRELIDEMMASIRAATNRDVITQEDRATAETHLASIMERVHSEALQVGDRRG